MSLQNSLEQAGQRGASDILLAPGQKPFLRICGELQSVEAAEPLAAEDIANLLAEMMSPEDWTRFDTAQEIDFAADYAGQRFRVSAFQTHKGAAAVLRPIRSQIYTLEDLGAPPILRQLAEIEKGLVLVTGPAGSGKSTTLAAMLNHINHKQARHILTIENPVEIVHSPVRSVINQRELGRNTASCAHALKSALREDPDVIMIGEIPDHETLSHALIAAENGHLVLASLHTSSAARTLDRLIDLFPPQDREMACTLLANNLQATIAQVLLKRRDGTGRVAAYEVLTGTPAVRNLIRENQIPQVVSMMQIGQRFGMQTMADSVESLARRGIISENEAWRGVMTAAGEDEPDISANTQGNGSDAEGELPQLTLLKARKPAPEEAPAKTPPQEKSGKDGNGNGDGKDGQQDRGYSF